ILGEGGVVRGRSKSDSQSASLRFAMAKPQNAEPISSLVNNAGLVTQSMWVFGGLSGIVWLLVLILPFCFRSKSIHPKFHIHIVLVCQSLFSAIQSGVGFLMILGKQV
ncbi:hypothetical protein, partial [Neorhodopirellula pilleata]|uniref:hypothetical protein n=1 Tax=Neorhodopirellula pilleata TaxID=2714738 RepID=UPI001E5E048C